jgi:hypothetical protein
MHFDGFMKTQKDGMGQRGRRPSIILARAGQKACNYGVCSWTSSRWWSLASRQGWSLDMFFA